MNKSISIAKAIGIILMVIGHSGCPELIHKVIYMFHMPLFFFLSGWCFKEKYIDTPLVFIKRRVLGLYLPFVSIALCFLFLHNSFIDIGIISGERYSMQIIGDRAKSIIISMHKEEQLIGGFWFLPQLFYASFIFFFTLKFIRSRYLSLLIISIIAVILYMCDFTIPYTGIGFVSFYGASFMMFGLMLKNRSNFNRNIILGLLLTMLVSTILFPSGIFIKDVYYFLPYMVAAVSGSVLTILCSNYISSVGSKRLINFLSFLGDNTLYVLTLHLLAFKLVTLFLIRLNSLPGSYLSNSLILENGSHRLAWILYSIIGVAVPTIVALAINRLRFYFKIRYNHSLMFGKKCNMRR